MREVLWINSSVRGWCIRIGFVHTTKSGSISELSSNINKLGCILLGGILNRLKET